MFQGTIQFNPSMEDTTGAEVDSSSDDSGVREAQSEQDERLAEIIVKEGFCTQAEMDGVVEWRKHIIKQGREAKSLPALILDNNLITPNQLKRCRDKADDAQPRQQIPGFQIIDKLGAGAMATVFRARQLSLDRTVAIKVLPKRFTKDPEFVQRFYEEGRAAGKLNHPNIVGAFDVGKAGEYHYFVMELVEGHTVYDHMVENNRYKEDEALKVVIEIARALKHAHDKGFIHRDVKPKNIMITKTGVAKLADMGLARQASDREAAEAEAGRAFGTPYYISPEQIRGSVDVDFSCDIYGLGATFYHMVTGRVPFDGDTPSNVMRRHLKDPLVPPDHIAEDLSAGISEIIEVMMAKDPEDRYETTADLLTDLESVAAGGALLQARGDFHMSSLSNLEMNAKPAITEDSKEEQSAKGVKRGKNVTSGGPKRLTEQPLFMVCIAEGLIILALLIVVLMQYIGI